MERTVFRYFEFFWHFCIFRYWDLLLCVFISNYSAKKHKGADIGIPA